MNSTALSTRFSKALRPWFGRDPFDDLQQEIDSLLSRFKTDGNGDWPAALISPPVDLSEKDDAI